MKFFVFVLLVISSRYYTQNKIANASTFKGEHFALYNKCMSAVTFCENTQQTYTSCGSSKNCYGLYVLPGDTFYINIEDKNQAEIISADMSFSGYFTAITGFTFQPIDNNCIPQQALQITIPLTAVPGSSFEIVAQNTAYVNLTLNASTPIPFPIYVGGLQPMYTLALANFTMCPVINGISVHEIKSISISPNPSSFKIEIVMPDLQKGYHFKLYDINGLSIKSGGLREYQNELLINDLKTGLYFISIYSNIELIATKKIIVTPADN